jgi:hypothetical protein
MSDHIPDATKMVPDGYYTALVQCDTGGEIFQAVEVCEGKIFRSSGLELNASACSDFIPLAACNFCSAFPVIAGAELETLRTANAALVERMKRLEEAGDAMLNAWLMPEDAMEYSDWVALSSDAKRKWYRAKATP